MHKLLSIAALAAALATPAYAAPSGDALSIVTDLTTDVGQRLGGTAREAAARDWAVARLSGLGFANVHIETFPIQGWERGEEKASITAPVPQKLAVTALGYSGATLPQGITGDLVYFPNLDALKSTQDGALKGKIAFIDHAFKASQDGAGYGLFGAARRQGPAIAAQKGASALLIRSIGTDHIRSPHTGVTQAPKQGAPLAAGAVSNPDADLIARLAAKGPMSVAVTLTPKFTGQVTSGNVIADLPGRDPKLAPILIACHLDSWDLGTGAIDDGAGCAIITAAALQASKSGQLARTIRVLWAGTEEMGGFGGQAYAKAHAKEPHAVVLESDTGADRIFRVSLQMAAADQPLAERIAADLARFGITRGSNEAEGGEDVGYIAQAQKTAIIDLNQDMTRYFDWHHTPDDTLDKIDPAQLQQNVDVWAAVLKILGNVTGPIAATG
jgi:carboxypeptidase Q